MTALYVGKLITLLYIPALILSAIVSMLIAGRRAIVDHVWGWPLWLSGLLVLLVGLTVVNPLKAARSDRSYSSPLAQACWLG